jgi:hypothetical protein
LSKCFAELLTASSGINEINNFLRNHAAAVEKGRKRREKRSL